METLNRIKALMPGEIAAHIDAAGDDLVELRLRAERPIQIRSRAGEWLSEESIDAVTLNRVLAALLDHSVYARESELRQGFFTTADGCRVGVCGRLVHDGERVTGLAGAGSLCVRVCREIRGCADGLLDRILEGRGTVRSTLIVSPPGMGKTTLLRELARCVSNEGFNVCVSDERHEIAACVNGVPTLDVGFRTDVMDSCPKRIAIPHLLRASAPDVIVADEIGEEGDALTLAEARRCGVAVIASAHADSLEQLAKRRSMGSASEVFECFALLGGEPGRILEIREGLHADRAGAVRGGRLRHVRKRHGLRGAAQGGYPRRSDSGARCAQNPHDAHA